VRLVEEELINGLLLFNSFEDIGSQDNNVFERLIQEMRFKSQLEFGYVLTGYSFVMQAVQFASNHKRIKVIKSNREEHLTISKKFLQHFGVAVFQGAEELFDLLEYLLLGLGRVDPFSKMVKELFLIHFSVFFTAERSVDIHHTLAVSSLILSHTGHTHAI
jgi:hypothetical protein